MAAVRAALESRLRSLESELHQVCSMAPSYVISKEGGEPECMSHERWRMRW